MRSLLASLLSVLCLGLPACAAAKAFDQTFALQGLRFHVSCPNDSSLNTLRIVPDGLERENTPTTLTIDGVVSGADMADLNADGYPELYIYVFSAGSGSYGELIAFASNRNKSITPIYLPPIMDNETLASGYMGHDRFSIGDGVILRHFPLYRPDDSNATPTGGLRQIQYRLVAGEASWILEVDKVTDH